ncbi:MAG: hypothetical protein WA581_19060 [Candidatus Acidiferrales bacterium]
MNVNHKRYSAGWKPFLGVLLAVCFLATAAHADSLFSGKFTLTHEVRLGNALLAPGRYSVVLNEHFITVSDAKTGKIVARELAVPNFYETDRDSRLFVTQIGNQRAVSAVRLEGFGEVFQQAHPFPVSKRAAEEAHNTEAIPVELAKK